MRIQQLLQMIQARPEMYLGEATLSRLDAFLLGWLFESGDSDTASTVRRFQEFIATKYRMNSSHSWANMIRFFSSNDVDALRQAFNYWDEFFQTSGGGVEPSAVAQPPTDG
jgi:hypothetical protein